jgi:hypothetical protein
LEDKMADLAANEFDRGQETARKPQSCSPIARPAATTRLAISFFAALSALAAAGAAHAQAAAIPVVVILELAALLVGGTVQTPRMTEAERFIYWQEPQETDIWVHWQKRGSFAGREASTATGRGLLLVREELRAKLVDQTHRLDEAGFDLKFGTAATPNWCALSKATIAAGFAMRYGGRPEDYDLWKHSRCTL